MSPKAATNNFSPICQKAKINTTKGIRNCRFVKSRNLYTSNWSSQSPNAGQNIQQNLHSIDYHLYYKKQVFDLTF